MTGALSDRSSLREAGKVCTRPQRAGAADDVAVPWCRLGPSCRACRGANPQPFCPGLWMPTFIPLRDLCPLLQKSRPEELIQPLRAQTWLCPAPTRCPWDNDCTSGHPLWLSHNASLFLSTLLHSQWGMNSSKTFAKKGVPVLACPGCRNKTPPPWEPKQRYLFSFSLGGCKSKIKVRQVGDP